MFMRPGAGRTYSDVTAPLRRLTVKSVKFVWDKQCQKSFDELKTLLCSTALLANYDPALQTRLYVDHGPKGVASTVAQLHPEGWRSVCYQSRSLTKAEMNYGKVDGESLAVLSGIMANRNYLYGTKFTVVGDHLPLIPLYKSHSRELPVRVARHRSKLGGFDFQLQYEPGSTNPSDYGSRHLMEEEDEQLRNRKPAGGVEAEEEEAEFIVNRVAHELPDAVSWLSLQHFTDKDQQLQTILQDVRTGKFRQVPGNSKFKECFRELSISDGLLLRGEKIVIPAELRPDVLAAAHEGHPGVVGMLRQLRQSVWWPGITADVTEYVGTCTTGCAPATARNSPPPMIMRETPERPWQHVAVDYKGPIIGNGRSYYFHVMIDLLSRWPEVTVVHSTSFDKLQDKLEDIFALHGVPETVTSDNGPPYQSQDWKEFAKQMGFKPIFVSPEHPEGNGVAERFMATLVKTTHAAISENKDPKLEIKRRLLNYRNTPHPSTGECPSQLMMGRMIRTRIPRVIKSIPTTTLEKARKKDVETRELRKQKYDKRKTARDKDIKEGDQVLLSQRKTTVKPPYNPHPFTVTDVKGTQVIAQRGNSIKTRNMGKVKLLRKRPDRLKHNKTIYLPDKEESDDEDWLYLLDTARINTEHAAPQALEEQQGDEPDEGRGEAQAETRVQEAEIQRKGARNRIKTRFYGREEEQEDEPRTGKQLSPRARKRIKSQAAKTSTPRREMMCNIPLHINCKGRLHPPGSISTPEGRRRERWKTRQEEFQTEGGGIQVSD